MQFSFKRSILAVSLLTLAAGLAQAEEVVRIGYQKYGTLITLKARGTLEQRLAKDGVKVQWTEFPGGPQLLEGLNVGSIDFGVTGETPPVFAQAAGADLVYVANEPPAPTSEAILVPKDSPIQSLHDLKGKKIALNKGSNVHYLLVQALAKAGIAYKDIQPVYLPPADARAAFERGAVDAWVIWDPYQAAAETQLQARTLTDATGLADNHQFYLATRSFAAAHPEQVGAIVDEVRAVGEWAKAHPDEVAAQVAPLLNLPLETAERVVQRQGYGARFITPEVAAQQQRIADAFTALKLIPKPLVIRDVVWTPPASLQTAAAKP